MEITLQVSEEEFGEIIFGLQTIISDRCTDRADREGLEALIARLQEQAKKQVQETKSAMKAFYSDERNHLYVDPDGVGPILDLE